MHTARIYYTAVFLLIQLLPRSFAAVPDPEAASGATGDVDSAGRPGNPGSNGVGSDDPVAHPNVPPDYPLPGSTGDTPGGPQKLGEAFQEAIDLINSALQDIPPDPTSTVIAGPITDGSIITGPLVIGPGPVPTTSVTDSNARACLQANSIYNGCAAQTSGFASNNYSSQASCLCYTTSSGMVGWQPQTFDALMSSCYTYMSSHLSQATAASSVIDHSGLCTSLGDVRVSKLAQNTSIPSNHPTASQTSTSTSASVPPSTGGATSNSLSGFLFFATGILFGRAFCWGYDVRLSVVEMCFDVG